MSHTVHTFEGTISGMTCGHCVASVTEEIQEIHVVTAVDVTLETGAVSITSD
jgi:copper chaperone CopZ